MNSNPKVSVVMTCYKYAHYLPQAIDSVLGQSYGNVEVVMVNDGSPDNTDEVMQPYLRDPRVVYIKQENSGQAIAKNNGIKAATGDFIAFLDADDAWDLRKLELQMPLFADPEVGIVYSGMSYMDEDGKPIAGPPVQPMSMPRAGRITEALFVDNIVPFSAAVVRRECFEACGMMDTSYRMAIDWDLWLRMSVRYKFDFVAEPLLRYRLGHAGQMSKNLHVREGDTMRIMQNFLASNPGLLPRRLVRWVMAYSYCLRGYRNRRTDGWKSLRCYLQAIRWRWMHGTAYAGIAKLIVYKALAVPGLVR
jgi:glycosyltransferase involved in cell wall biosynthesis